MQSGGQTPVNAGSKDRGRNSARKDISMKYQIRIKDTMSDKPASKLFDTREEAENKLAEVREEIRKTWATPDVNSAYIFINKFSK